MVFASEPTNNHCKSRPPGMVTAYLKQVPTDEPRPLAVETAVEALLVDPTTGENLGIPLVGIMDLVLDGHDGAEICDFKTSFVKQRST